jgi:hypothetical protein
MKFCFLGGILSLSDPLVGPAVFPAQERLDRRVGAGIGSGMMEDASGGWGKLGLGRDPVPGDPQVLQQVIDDCQYLRDTAWSVSQGLDAFLAVASAGGFEGATADALRGAISGRLKTFIQNIGRAFSLAGEAVAGYRRALVQAQQAVSGLLSQAQGPAAKDPELTGVKQRVSDQVARVQDAEAVMIRALEDASAMVSQPITMPSLAEKIWKGTEKALWITATVLGALSTIVDGPLGIAATAAGTASFAMTLTDYARGETKLPDVLLSLTSLLFPATKGFFTLEQVGRGLRGFAGALGQAEGKAAQVLASPSELAAFAAQGLARTRQGLTRVPGLLVDGVRALPEAVASLPQMPKLLGKAVGQDFATVQKRYPELGRVLTPAGVYTVVTFGRGLGALFTPMTIQDLTRWGFRGAWRAGWARASWRNAARAFSAGWASKGLQAAYPAMDVGHTVEYWRRFTPKPVITGEAPAAGLVVPGPVLWADREPGGLVESVLIPVNTGTTRDLGHAGFLDGMRPAPHQDTYVLTVGEQVTALDMLSAPAVSRLDQGTFQLGERPLVNGAAGRSVELEDVPVAPPEVLSVRETLELLRGPQAAQASARSLENLETAASRTGTVAPGYLTQPELNTTVENSHAERISPATLNSRIQMMLHCATESPSENITVSVPPVRTEVVREGWTQPAGVLHGVPHLEGVQVRTVSQDDGQPPHLELVEAHGDQLADRAALPQDALCASTSVAGPQVEAIGEAFAEQAEVSSRSAWDVESHVDLDHEYGPLIACHGVRDWEQGPDGRIKLNPLWYRLSDFEPAFLERKDACWFYTVDASGEIFLGCKKIDTIFTGKELERLPEGIRHSNPEMTVDALKKLLNKQGYPTIAVEFDESGKTTGSVMSRISGELAWNRDTARWQINDRSGRYMLPRIAHALGTHSGSGMVDVDFGRWMENVATRMSARFGIEVTPGLPKFEEPRPAPLLPLSPAMEQTSAEAAPREISALAPVDRADRADLELVAYQREATRFERKLGAYLVQHPKAMAEVAKFARTAWERIPREERYRFGIDDPKLAGAVGHDYQVLEEVALKGNIREQFLFLRVAASQKKERGLFAQYTGHSCEVPSELNSDQKCWDDYHPVVPEPAMSTFRKILPPSRREAAFSGEGTLWQSGETQRAMAFLPSSAGGKRLPFDDRTFQEGPHITAQRTGGLVTTGISGTTWRMLHYAEAANAVWKAGLDLRWIRLALIGHYLAAGHHTLHEVLTAADMWAREEGHSHLRAYLGFEYHDNWGRYRHLTPLTERELREHVALGGLFPDELVRGPDLPAYDPVDDARQALAEHLSAPHGAAASSAPEVAGSSHLPSTGWEFTVTPVDGGTGYDVVHEPTGLRTRFVGEAHEVVYHEANPGFGPNELRKLKVAAHYVRQGDGKITRFYELREPGTGGPFTGRFTVKPAPQDLCDSRQAAFSVRDRESGLRLHYLADGRPVARDQQLAKGLGYLRFDMFQPGADPQWLDPKGKPTALFRAEPLDGERVALIAARPTTGPLEGFVVDPENGRVLQETLATPEDGRTLPDGSWEGPDGLKLNPEMNALVEHYFERARATEPHLTKAMKSIAHSVDNSKLSGLEHRLKSEHSLKRRIAKMLLKYPELTLGQALGRIHDAVRYTLEIPTAHYACGVQQAIDKFRARGYENVNFKNKWKQNPNSTYKGINSTWRDPVSGQIFELQFHTTESFTAAMGDHVLYEKKRRPGISPRALAAIKVEQEEWRRKVPVPHHAKNIRLDHAGHGPSPAGDDGQAAARRTSVHIPNGERTVVDSATRRAPGDAVTAHGTDGGLSGELGTSSTDDNAGDGVA